LTILVIGASKYGDGAHAAVEANLLFHADGGPCDLEIAVAEWDSVEALNDVVDNVAIFVLSKSDALARG